MPDDRSSPIAISPRLSRRAVAEARDPVLTPYPKPEERAGASEQDDDFDFWELARGLLRRKFMILAIVLAGTGASLFLTLQQTPLYRASSTLEIQRQETRIIESADVEPRVVADNQYIETQFALLKSRALAERVVDDLDLANNPAFANQQLGREQRLKNASDQISRNLMVGLEGKSLIIRVGYVSPSPEDAARITNTVVETFIEASLERKFNTTAYARKFLEERLATAKVTLEDAERRLVDYARDEDILDLSEGGGGGANLDAGALVTLSSEFTAAQNDRIAAELRYREVLENDSTTEFLDNEELRRLRARRSDLMAEYQEKLGTYKPDYPDMMRLQTRIDAVEAEIAASMNAIRLAAGARLDAARAREASLAERVDGLKGVVQDERERKIDYTIIQREVDTARSQYEALLQRMKEVSVAGGVGASQISVVDRAVPPTFPFSPNLSSALAVAFVFSFGFAVALTLGLNFIDDTIKTPEDIKEKLGLGTIGVIPKAKGRKRDVMEEAVQNPRSPITEAFFSARTVLDFTTTEGAPRSFVVTSSRAGEGKTSSALMLGVSFAKSGRRVLIIDGDMRKPSFLAKAGASVGLSGLLTSDENLAENIVAGPTPNLFLVPSGVIPPNPAELLSSSKLFDIIEHARELFDIVIVDSPPLLGFADGPIFGSVCDAGIMVIEAGAIRRPNALRSVERLLESQTNLVGVILTKFDPKKSGYESSYYYYTYGKGAHAYGNSRSGSKVSRARKVSLFLEAERGEPKGYESE